MSLDCNIQIDLFLSRLCLVTPAAVNVIKTLCFWHQLYVLTVVEVGVMVTLVVVTVLVARSKEQGARSKEPSVVVKNIIMEEAAMVMVVVVG